MTEFEKYQASLKAYEELKYAIKIANEVGEKQGIENGKTLMIKNALKAGLSIGTIAKVMNLTTLQIENLK